MPRRSAVPAPSTVQKPAAAPKWLRAAMLALAAVLLMGTFSTEVSNPDTWWHLKTGEYIRSHRALPVPDPFAYTTYLKPPTFPGEEMARYFNLTHEWLAQVLFHMAYSAGGFPALILLRALLLTAFCGTVGLIVWRRTGGFYRSLGAALLAASVAIQFAADRPFLFTFLFVAVTIAVLDYHRFELVLPPLFLVWANLHGGFFLGWVVLGVYCIAHRQDRKLWLISGAAVLCSLVNPNGYNAVLVTLAYRKSAMQMNLWEWHPTALWPLEAFGVTLLAALVVLIWARRRVQFTDWVLFALFAAAGLVAVRNAILVAIIGPVVIASYVPWKRALPAIAEYAAAVLLVAALAAGVARGSMFQLRAAFWQYPAGAADFLLNHGIRGRLFNTYEHGGYLIWRLGPAQKVFIDGRALNEAVFHDYQRIVYNADNTGGKSGAELLDEYGVQTIVMDGFEFNSGAAYLLPIALADPVQKTWKLVYQDAQAVVFVRHPPPDVQPLNSLDALVSMEEQCRVYMEHSPEKSGCAKTLAGVFAQIGDPVRARRWSQ